MASPRTDLPVDTPDPGARRRVNLWRGAGVATMLLIALFWFWIFSGAPRRQNPDFLDDRAWVERAEDTCTATMEGIDARGEGSEGSERTREQRADEIDASSADLRAMLAALADPPPTATSDREVVEQWVADWNTHLSDRDRYADAIRTDPGARFITTEKFGDQIETVIETFADVNEMPACGPAGDVG